MVSVREWNQSAAMWARQADEALAAKDYDEARKYLGRSKRHALCAVRLQAEIDKAWKECERDHVKGDNPRGFPHLYFHRGYEAALTAAKSKGGQADG